MIDPRPVDTPDVLLGDQLVLFNGDEVMIKDIPDRVIRVMLGYGHDNDDNRSVVIVEGRPWESTPDVCTYGSLNWEWITVHSCTAPDGPHPPVGCTSYLVCPKCGLDGT
jgi:hypothetical protein